MPYKVMKVVNVSHANESSQRERAATLSCWHGKVREDCKEEEKKIETLTQTRTGRKYIPSLACPTEKQTHATF